MENDFVPSELIKTIARKWWVLVLAMVLGGLAGMLISRAHKPVYQSQATITTAVDYAYTGSLEDYELDHLIMAVGDVIDSTAVRESVVESELSEDSSSSSEEILNRIKPHTQGKQVAANGAGFRPVDSAADRPVVGNRCAHFSYDPKDSCRGCVPHSGSPICPGRMPQPHRGS